MKDMYIVYLYYTMYIFSIHIHILYVNVGLLGNVSYKYTTFLCCFSRQYSELQL